MQKICIDFGKPFQTVHPQLEQVTKKMLLLQVEKLRLERENLELKGQLAEFEAKLQRVVSLCHPDKHGGSEIANDITGWLLGLKEQQPDTRNVSNCSPRPGGCF